MKKIIFVWVLIVSTGATVYAFDKEKGRKTRKEAGKKEMRCCDKEMAKECKKEGKSCYEKKAEQ